MALQSAASLDGEASGRQAWTEADSLLPETPVRSMELASGTTPGAAHRARLSLYASHFLSTWGARAWEFAAGLVMLQLYPSSLLMVSVFGLCDAGAQALLGPAVGAYVDRTPRLKAACSCYVVQNVSVALSAGACLALMWTQLAPPAPAYWALMCVAILAGCLSSVGAMGATLSVEREWTKALCGTEHSALAGMNATMKRIDLTCLIVSPVGVGLLLAWKPAVAVAAVMVYNLVVWGPECALLARAQAASPALSAPKQQPVARADKPSVPGAAAAAALNACGLYAGQPAALAAVSLALLYLTVMSFGTLMTAYLKWRGVSEAWLAIYRGLGAGSGILATLAFPPLHNALGLTLTGTVAIWAQLACLMAAVLAQLLPPASAGAAAAAGGDMALYALLWGLVLSRFGLWLFDLAANQLIQESVAQGALGAVSGVQSSLQNLAQLLAYAAGVAVWRPQHFPLLMAGSVGAVAAAAMLFTWYALEASCGLPAVHTQPATPLTP